MTIEAVGEAFTRQFQHFDGYKSPARQADLERVFRAGAHWQAEQDRLDESEIAKVAAQRAVRVAELEADLAACREALDRLSAEKVTVEAAKVLACQVARAERAEAKLAKVREYVEPVAARPSVEPWMLSMHQACTDVLAILAGGEQDVYLSK